MTSDTEASRAFYTQLFGWTAEEPNAEFGGYFNFVQDGVRIAGGMASQGDSGPDVWSVYLATDNAEKTLEAAASHGGQVHVQAMPVGDLGVMAYVTDPSGAMTGLWQPGEHKGFGRFGESWTPSWFELHTRDYRAVLDFYRDVFQWETEVVGDTDDFRYSTLKHGEEQLAGIMDSAGFLPEGTPSHWEVYFGTPDADATLAKAVELDGKILEPAVDTPYGRLAAAADPTGARFKLVAPNESMPARAS
jgi:hypothetical protein